MITKNNLLRIVLFLGFTIFYLFFWQRYSDKYAWLSALLNKMYASMAIYNTSSEIYKNLNTETLRNRIWKHFSTARTYLFIYGFLELIKQVVVMINKGEIILKNLSLEFLFRKSFHLSIWADLAFVIVFKMVPYFTNVSLVFSNFATY